MTKDLKEKIKLAKETIKLGYLKNDGKIFVSFSGGKDSTILMHIARSLYPNIKIVFSNTTNEMKEVLTFVKKQKNVEWVTPTITFTDSLKLHGFPLVSKEVAHFAYQLKNTNGIKTKNLRLYGSPQGIEGTPGMVGKLSKKWLWLAEQKFNLNNKCCQRLKKDPLTKWAKQNDMKPIIGIMAGESRTRQQLALFGKDSKGQIYPFLRSGWTEEDIWAYAKEFNIRFAECYYDREVNGVFLKGEHRTGCEYCGFGIDREENDRFLRSRTLTPKRFEKIMQIENGGVSFKKALDLVMHASDQKVDLGLFGYNIIEKDGFKIYLDPIHNYPKGKCSCGGKILKIDKKDILKIKDIDNKVLYINYYKGQCDSCGLEYLPTFPFINLSLKKTDRLIHSNKKED